MSVREINPKPRSSFHEVSVPDTRSVPIPISTCYRSMLEPRAVATGKCRATSALPPRSGFGLRSGGAPAYGQLQSSSRRGCLFRGNAHQAFSQRDSDCWSKKAGSAPHVVEKRRPVRGLESPTCEYGVLVLTFCPRSLSSLLAGRERGMQNLRYFLSITGSSAGRGDSLSALFRSRSSPFQSRTV